MKKLITSFSLIALSICLATASQINFSASVANNLAGVGGADLATADQVEIGIFDSLTSSFTSFLAAPNDNVGFGPGFFSHSVKSDTSALAGSQIAFRWTEAASGLSAIAYYDITTGTDSGLVNIWTLLGGDGTALDTNVQTVDIAQLTTGGPSYGKLSAAAVLIGAEFSGSNSAGAPSFNAVPEPSTYAAIVGLLALALGAYRRRFSK